MLIQIVDDDKDDVDFFCEAIHAMTEKHECMIASDGRQALAQLEKSKLPDVIFLDVNMPIMNGKEYLTAIKTHSKYKSIPVYVFSTTSRTGEIASLMKLGAKAFIVKPPSFEKLLVQVREILSLSKK
jgi:CheY-like chemotaxis protein